MSAKAPPLSPSGLDGHYAELGEFLEIFQPIYARRLKKTQLTTMRFAYYTSAGTGINILKGHQLWMRLPPA